MDVDHVAGTTDIGSMVVRGHLGRAGELIAALVCVADCARASAQNSLLLGRLDWLNWLDWLGSLDRGGAGSAFEGNHSGFDGVTDAPKRQDWEDHQRYR